MKIKTFPLRLLCILLIVITVPRVCFAQDVHFSQYHMSPLTLNPALAGAVYEKQGLINYKDQWGSITSPYKTLAASYDMRLDMKKIKKGFWAGGINFFSDKAGDSQMGTLQANLTAAYHVLLNKYNTLGAGMQGGVVQRSINYSALQSGNQYNGNSYNPVLPIGEPFYKPSFTYADIGAGILWAYNNTAEVKVTDNNDFRANAGFSIYHITQPNYSFYSSNEKLQLKYVLHGNVLIGVPNTNVAFVPGFMYYVQGPLKELFTGSLIRYKLKQDSKYTGVHKGAAFSLGVFLRTKDAIIASMLLELSNYAIGMSYDVNTSRLIAATNSRGSFEITLRFTSPNPFVTKKL
jgi:type IX secretion system PorP/SprF family membrane protein